MPPAPSGPSSSGHSAGPRWPGCSPRPTRSELAPSSSTDPSRSRPDHRLAGSSLGLPRGRPGSDRRGMGQRERGDRVVGTEPDRRRAAGRCVPPPPALEPEPVGGAGADGGGIQRRLGSVDARDPCSDPRPSSRRRHRRRRRAGPRGGGVDRRCQLRRAARDRPPAVGGRPGRDRARGSRLRGGTRTDPEPRPDPHDDPGDRHRRLHRDRGPAGRPRLARAPRGPPAAGPARARRGGRTGDRYRRRRVPRDVRGTREGHPLPPARSSTGRRRSGSTSAPGCTPASAS
jgi:hypothetical protein